MGVTHLSFTKDFITVTHNIPISKLGCCTFGKQKQHAPAVRPDHKATPQPGDEGKVYSPSTHKHTAQILAPVLCALIQEIHQQTKADLADRQTAI